jgi:hypothetical protein
MVCCVLTMESLRSVRAFSSSSDRTLFTTLEESDFDDPVTERLRGLGDLVGLQLCLRGARGSDSDLSASVASFWGGTAIALPWITAWGEGTLRMVRLKTHFLTLL